MVKPKLDKQSANHHLTQEGYFWGMRSLFDHFDVDDTQAITLRTSVHKHLLIKVREAKAEADRLQKSLATLEAACNAGVAPMAKGASRAAIADAGRVMGAMQAVDGWIISLLETNISLLATIYNPETAGNRVNTLKDQFAELWRLRYQPNAKGNRYRPFDNYGGIFDLTLTLPE